MPPTGSPGNVIGMFTTATDAPAPEACVHSAGTRWSSRVATR